MRKRIYQLIELSTGEDIPSRVYDIIMFVSILISLIPMMFRRSRFLFIGMEWLATSIFIIDYLLRLCTADLKFPKLKKGAFFVYPFTPLAIIDLLSILPTILLMQPKFRLFVMLRLMRAIKVFRIFKLTRYSKGVRMFVNIFRAERDALIAVTTLAVSFIFLAALIMYNVEPALFPNFFSALYWATITMTSVGYGDIAPSTFIGRIVSMFSSVVGIAIVALPTGIITAGFMKEILNPADKTAVREAVKEAVDETTVRAAVKEAVEQSAVTAAVREAVNQSDVRQAVREAVDPSAVKEAVRDVLDSASEDFDDALEAALNRREEKNCVSQISSTDEK